MATVLWCYLRNSAFEVNGTDYHVAADLTGQANHLDVACIGTFDASAALVSAAGISW